MNQKEYKKTSPTQKKSPQIEFFLAKGRDKNRTINRRRHFTVLLMCLFLIIATSAIYWQVGNHEFINFDDGRYITGNPRVQAGLTRENVVWAFTTTDVSNWHPLTWLSHMLDCQLYGLNPKGHHLTNLLFHLINTVLLFLLLRRMTGALWHSAIVAALFAVHPLHVESVAWVSERKDVLSTLFWVLTMWMYVRYVERPGIKTYLAMLLAFSLGLMAKPMLVTLPFVLLLLDYWPLTRVQVGQLDAALNVPAQPPSSASKAMPQALRLVWEKAPLFALAAVSSLVTFLVQKSGGALRDLEIYPIKTRMANMLVSYAKYIGKMIWPQNLAVFYQHQGSSLPMWQAAGAGLLLVGITILVMRKVRSYPYLAVGWLWYLGTLIPVIGLVQAGGQAMADRYTYVPLIGLFIMIVWAIPELVAGWHHRRLVLGVGAGTLLATLMICTWLQVQHWQSSNTLFEHAIKVTTGNYVAHNNLAYALHGQGRLDEAIDQYTEALRIKPNYALALVNLGEALHQQGRIEEAIACYRKVLRINPRIAEVHNNLGVALANQGRFDEAIDHYMEALRINRYLGRAHGNLGKALEQRGKIGKNNAPPDAANVSHRSHANALNNLAVAFSHLQKFDEAIEKYNEVLRIMPDWAEGHNNLANVLAWQGRIDAAITHYSEALRLKPDYAEAHNNLAVILAQQRKFDQATTHYLEALRLNPDSPAAHNNLASTLIELGKFDDAITHLRKAVEIMPDYAEAYNTWGDALSRKGRLDEAASYFSKALQLNPNYAEAHNNLGVVLARQGRLAEAIIQFRDALRLKPDYMRARANLELALEETGRTPNTEN